MKINVIDILIVILIARTISVGKKKGLSIELGDLAIVLLSWTCALSWYQPLGMYINNWFLLSIQASCVISYTIIYVLAFILTFVGIRFLRKVMTLSFIDGVEKVGGIIVGALKGIFLAMAILILCALIPNKLIYSEFYKKSFLGGYFVDVSPRLYQWVWGKRSHGSFDKSQYFSQTNAGKKEEIL